VVSRPRDEEFTADAWKQDAVFCFSLVILPSTTETVKISRDFLVLLAFGDKLKDLPLPISQLNDCACRLFPRYLEAPCHHLSANLSQEVKIA
jgi:hypothetical protein